MSRLAAALGLLGLLVVATAAPAVARDEALPDSVGLASWYGPGFAGRRMADGQRFAPGGLSAASRRWPLGSRVRVTNLGNGRSVAVTITDRGPYVRGRILDLSPGAAQRLRMLRDGLVTVDVQPMPVGARRPVTLCNPNERRRR